MRGVTNRALNVFHVKHGCELMLWRFLARGAHSLCLYALRQRRRRFSSVEVAIDRIVLRHELHVKTRFRELDRFEEHVSVFAGRRPPTSRCVRAGVVGREGDEDLVAEVAQLCRHIAGAKGEVEVSMEQLTLVVTPYAETCRNRFPGA